MGADVNIFFFLNGLAGKSPLFDAFIVFFAEYFPYVLVAAFLLLLLFGEYPGPRKVRMLFFTAVSVVIARLWVTEIIRFFYHRPRPFLVYQVIQLFPEHEWSFPSGHAAFFFALASALYGYDKKWGMWFFAGGFMVSISRIIAGVHYPSDIAGGIAVGVGVAYLVSLWGGKIWRSAGATADA